MSIAKPFVFAANTYAKSTEVNANFDTVYSQVNTNISNIAKNATDIDNLENNKADINGNASQRFAVADAVTNSDAVNKSYLMSAIGNSIDLISGLIITRDSGSPNNTIIVSKGSCYDSTHAVVLYLNNSLSKQNLNQGANTTYYVYIIGNSSASQTDILISTEQETPTLPTGYSLYRLIGGYTTNSSSNILNIYGIADYRFDGQWVNKSATVKSTNSLSNGTHDYNVDISSYLPTDNYDYEVLLSGFISGDGATCTQYCASSIISSYYEFNYVGAGADKSSGALILPVGTNRIIKYRMVGTVEYSSTLKLAGYRRIGINN